MLQLIVFRQKSDCPLGLVCRRLESVSQDSKTQIWSGWMEIITIAQMEAGKKLRHVTHTRVGAEMSPHHRRLRFLWALRMTTRHGRGARGVETSRILLETAQFAR